MKTTEKRHWVNGYQVRGGWFKTLNMSLFNYGVMLAWGKELSIKFYKLT